MKMTRASVTTAAAALVLVLAGCSGTSTPDASTPATSAAPSETGTPADPTPEATASSTPVALPTDIPETAMLTAADYSADADATRDEADEVDLWLLPEPCATGPVGSVEQRQVNVMGVITQDTQQLVTFADVAAASQAFDTVVAALEGCRGTDSDGVVYIPEELQTGDESIGLATDYGALFDQESGDEALGDYTVVVRVGNAVTLVTETGGEVPLGDRRTTAMGLAAQATTLMCRYGASGCEAG